jgi:hypothetical protein
VLLNACKDRAVNTRETVVTWKLLSFSPNTFVFSASLLQSPLCCFSIIFIYLIYQKNRNKCRCVIECLQGFSSKHRENWNYMEHVIIQSKYFCLLSIFTPKSPLLFLSYDIYLICLIYII